ncbi:Holliday junction resolvase RuvX [Candidatus Dojkabacteria bacterium]|nr:Holliday junction resolvase RuvX [Candidatus Dojkabacteria bacterium]
MKVLAIDYGDKKTGLAISDEMGIVTTKLPVLFAQNEKHKIDGLIHVINEFKPDIVLFGVPSLSASVESLQEKIIREFSQKLKKELQKELTKEFGESGYKPKFCYWDESFSSQIVEKGRTNKYISKKADSDAARIFLQEFLDSPDGLTLLKNSKS